ncbi:hypothetical protein FBU30_001672 [Linnemannia zychae]|nr:hypothetical protein FBU30_001672 [Linnemannia zychae]
MARTNPPPALSIKTLFTPSTLVCLLALSTCTPTSALPISTPRSSTSSIPSDSTNDAPSNAINTRSIDFSESSSSTPFRTVSRPITIQIDLNPSSDDSTHPYERLIRQTEEQEQFFRNREEEAMARLAREQDELEIAEQDRDQELDNEEEEQLDQDPETIRRRQEESLGLWLTEAEMDAASSSSSYNSESVIVSFRDNIASAIQEDSQSQAAQEISEEVNSNSPFDLYAGDFKEVKASTTASAVVVNVGRRQNLRRLAPEYTEEEMLQWPIVNQAAFEDRQDEVQDEYEEDQA